MLIGAGEAQVGNQRPAGLDPGQELVGKLVGDGHGEGQEQHLVAVQLAAQDLRRGEVVAGELELIEQEAEVRGALEVAAVGIGDPALGRDRLLPARLAPGDQHAGMRPEQGDVGLDAVVLHQQLPDALSQVSDGLFHVARVRSVGLRRMHERIGLALLSGQGVAGEVADSAAAVQRQPPGLIGDSLVAVIVADPAVVGEILRAEAAPEVEDGLVRAALDGLGVLLGPPEAGLRAELVEVHAVGGH